MVELRRRNEEDDGKSRMMVQIFVKEDGARTSTMELARSDKVNDIVKRIPTSGCCNKCDVYVTFEGKVLKRHEELRSCGVSDGCTLQVVNKKNKLRRKQPRVRRAKNQREVNRSTMRIKSFRVC